MADDGTADIDGQILTDEAALAERIRERLLLYRGTWFLDTRSGLRRELLRGHQTSPEIAAAEITAQIRLEGGDEIIDIGQPEVRFDPASRTLFYAVALTTIYGAMTVSQEV